MSVLMNNGLNVFLLLYFAVFFGVAVAWRTYRVWRTTGINAFRLQEETGPEAITGRYFKLLPAGALGLLLLVMLWPDLYGRLGVISLLETAQVQTTGVALMLLALAWTILAQVQMGQSWRIGIDHDHRTALVTSGVFRYSRNPIFVGMMGCLAGLFLVLPGAISLLIFTLAVVLIQVQVSLEETHLQQLHGQDYFNYCQRVARWL